MVSGSARNVRDTKPPSVATLHSATNTTKNDSPSSQRRPGPIGTSGFMRAWPPRRVRVAPTRGAPPSLDEPRVRERIHVGQRLDHPHLEQQVGRLAAELRVLAGEEFLVGR